MNRMFVKAKIRLAKAMEEREAGQGTLEYVGVVIVAAILIVGAITAFQAFDLDSKLGEWFDNIDSELGTLAG